MVLLRANWLSFKNHSPCFTVLSLQYLLLFCHAWVVQFFSSECSLASYRLTTLLMGCQRIHCHIPQLFGCIEYSLFQIFFKPSPPSPSSYILLFYVGGTLFSKFSGQWGTCIASHGYLVLLTSLSFILNVGGWKTRWMLLLTELENHAYFWLIRCKLLLVSFEEAVESLLPPRFPRFLYLLFDLTIK